MADCVGFRIHILAVFVLRIYFPWVVILVPSLRADVTSTKIPQMLLKNDHISRLRIFGSQVGFSASANSIRYLQCTVISRYCIS